MSWRIVATDQREESIGRKLMEAVVSNPDLQDVAGLSLLCRRGLVSVYESVRFEQLDSEIDVPEGGTEELARMVYVRNE